MNPTTDKPNVTTKKILQFDKPTFWIVFFELLVLLQLALIFIFNLTHLKYEAGFDSSAAMAQAIEVWNQKTIFLKDWSYQSTLGLDSLLIPASLLYGITHNIFLAYGIADCLGVVLYICIFRDILKTLGTSKLARMIAYVILLTPYSLEPLGYMPMMFTGAAYYIVKVLIPIMLMDIMLKLHNKVAIKKFIPLLAIYGISLYLTGLSCGLYLFICGIIPIILYELFLVVKSGNLKNIISAPFLLILISTVIFAMGYISGKMYGASEFTNAMILCQVNNFTDNFFKCLVGIAELFGALPSQDIVVTSAFGIHYLSHMAAFLICIALLLITIKSVKPFSLTKKVSEVKITDAVTNCPLTQSTLVSMVVGMVTCIILVNLAVLTLTDTTYGSETFEFRYHLIPVVAGFLIVCIGIDNLTEWFRNNGNELLSHVILAIIGCIWILSNCVFAYYFKSVNMYDTSEQIRAVVKNELNYDRVYFVGEDEKVVEMSRIMRLTDPDLIVTDGSELGVYRYWGVSTKYYDPIFSMEKVLIVYDEEEYKGCDHRFQAASKLLATVDRYQIYEFTPSDVIYEEEDVN